MNCTLRTAAKVLTGMLLTAAWALPQAYTISAKPGVVNYIEGNVFLNGKPVSAGSAKAVFMNASDTLSTDLGKAEVLLTPGVFLRLGNNTQVRMVSPSLTDTQLEVKQGEAMVEADNIVKDSRVTVLTGGGSLQIDRDGLYRIRAGSDASVAVLEGKTSFYNGDRKTEIGKGHELFVAEGKTKKFDAKQSDDLYAWSNVRSEYNAASSYQAAKDINTSSSYNGVWGGYGFGAYGSSGWLWNSAFNSYAWLPGNGAFYSPFGYGFYSPGLIGYAPLMYAPIYGYGGGYPVSGGGGGTVVKAPTRPVPVNAAAPPAVGAKITSPMASQAARNQTIHTVSSNGGFRTANGTTVPAGRAAASAGYGGARGASAGTGHGNAGISAGPASGGFSGASAAHGAAAPASAAHH